MFAHIQNHPDTTAGEALLFYQASNVYHEEPHVMIPPFHPQHIMVFPPTNILSLSVSNERIQQCVL